MVSIAVSCQVESRGFPGIRMPRSPIVSFKAAKGVDMAKVLEAADSRAVKQNVS
jgi:hypothetical protein